MHTFSETGTGVPAFLAKLWRLVEDPETNDLISWSTDGRSFIIQNQAQFAKELLPLNYKHNNMASFIRQLNMYGFHKITSIDNGGLRFDKDEMEFTHACFQKDHPYLLEHIKRKIATSKQQPPEDKGGLKVEAVNRVFTELKNMRGRQDSLDTRFSAMKQENEALWREVAILRQKHLKQQQIVNKLIQFLVTIVQPSRSGLSSMGNGNNKRRFQLMINDAPQSKVKKTDNNEGATIQELGEALEEVAYENEQELIGQDKNESEKPTSSISVRKPRSSKVSIRTSEEPEVTSPSSMNDQSPYHPDNVDDIVEEIVISPTYKPRQRPVGVKQEEPDCSAILSDSLLQLTDGNVGDGEQHVEYDNDNYLVDHVVDEIDPNDIQLYNDTDMLNTPLVIKEIQKQQQLKQKQNGSQQQSVQQKSIGKGQSLLKMKKNGLANKVQQKSLLNASRPTQTDSNMLTRSGKRTATSGKQINLPTDDTGAIAGSSGSVTNVTTNTESLPSSHVGYGVNDFIINEVPVDIFDDSSNVEKSSPMIGAFNFDGGFYNPNVNINEIKERQQQSQQQQQQQQQQQLTEPAEVLTPNTLLADNGNQPNNDEELPNAGALARFSSNELDRLQSLSEYGQHIDAVQTDLDSLKDLLKGEGYQLDANTLLGTSSGNTAQYGRVFFSPTTPSTFDINKLFSGNEDIMGYDFPMNLPDMGEAQRKAGGENSMAVAETSGSSNSNGQISPTATNGSSNRLITYKGAPGGTLMGEYVDLNELLNLEGADEEENSTVI
ncbi:heat shock factor protein isoform X2 [Wyeomyia smithii]|uniref:heat shock factor protein isoform X2 n=1 Tax=Wyeomyia smithii TaxID=174621 RepID=UPI0024680D8F|nr:heat shock factor protein isoform X2 [Wyeomyia smithii]